MKINNNKLLKNKRYHLLVKLTLMLKSMPKVKRVIENNGEKK